MSRECPEQRKDFQGSRGARSDNSSFRPPTNSSNTFQAMRNQDDNGETKPAFAGWRGGATSANNNDSDDANKRSAFSSSATRGGFNSSGTGFRGKAVIW